jgi:cytochrome c oxidase subunit 3/cytochrome o ubiquinol oxidase subunit 3
MAATPVAHEDHHRAGKALGLDHLKLGMWLFLASEVMFFGGLIATFLHYKLNRPAPEGISLDVLLVGLNTVLLLTSSFTVVQGLASIAGGNRRGLVAYLGLTVLLGIAFLAGQANEFASLYREGTTLTSSLFGSTFFTLTGFHGLHVLIGVVWCLATVAKALRGGYSAADHVGVEVFGLYWHFVDVVWIVLFTVIYLI